MPLAPSYTPAPSFSSLGGAFFDVVEPALFPRHVLRFRNQRWADRLGLGGLTDDEWKRHFARFETLPRNLEQRLALRYHGHQFMSYNPNLGDGRAFLFAELRDPRDGRLLGLGSKGSGQTPWSRDGDGRLTLKGGVREVLATEMLEALGVYTSKSFSLYETGESLYRGDEPSPTRSSVLVRLSHSFIRFGSFQRLAFHDDREGLRRLLDFAIEHALPEVPRGGGDPVICFYREVSKRSARLVASWMTAGFVHGVLNSDNMNTTGESFDYGPYRFLPIYSPSFVAAYFDHGGLYAFGRQPTAVKWNLAALAEALTPLVSTGELREVYGEFDATFGEALAGSVVDRLGLASRSAAADADLAKATYDFLAESPGLGYEQFFFDWFAGAASAHRAATGPAAASYAGERFDDFRAQVERYDALRPERLEAPYFQSSEPCTLLIDELEEIWSAIAGNDDWSRFDAKIAAIRRMGAAYGCRP